MISAPLVLSEWHSVMTISRLLLRSYSRRGFSLDNTAWLALPMFSNTNQFPLITASIISE